MKKLKFLATKLILIVLLIFVILGLNGCINKDYTGVLNDYNKAFSTADNILISYYQSLYDLNRVLYFQDKRLSGQKRIEFENIGNYKKENYISVDFDELDARIKAVNGLRTYSQYLVELYSDKLPDITEKGINSIVDSIAKTSGSFTAGKSYTSKVDTGVKSGIIAGIIARRLLENRRNKMIKLYINKAEPIIVQCLDVLERDTIKIIQKNAEEVVYRSIQKDINHYNLDLLNKDTNKNIYFENLRSNELDNIQKLFTYYVSIKKSNPENIIKGMKQSQNELVNYVNSDKKDSASLLMTLEKFKSDIETINSIIP